MNSKTKAKCFLRKKRTLNSEIGDEFVNRRSSLHVNLSFTSSSSESEKNCTSTSLDKSANKTNSDRDLSEQKKVPDNGKNKDISNYTHLNLKEMNVVLTDINKIEIENITKLKNEILNKTKQLQDAELLLKTKNALVHANSGSKTDSQSDSRNNIIEISMLDKSKNCTKSTILLKSNASVSENSLSNTPKLTNSRKSSSLKRRLFTKENERQESFQEPNSPPKKPLKDKNNDCCTDEENKEVPSSPILSCNSKFNRFLRKKKSKLQNDGKSLNKSLLSSTFLETMPSNSEHALGNREKLQENSLNSMELTRAEGKILDNEVQINLKDVESSIDTVRTSLNVNTSLDKITNVNSSKNNSTSEPEINCRLVISGEESDSSLKSSLKVNTSVDAIGIASSDREVLNDSEEINNDSSPKTKSYIKKKSKVAGKAKPCCSDKNIFKAPTIIPDKRVVENKNKNDFEELEHLMSNTINGTIVYKTRNRYPSIYKRMTNLGLTLNSVIIDSPSEEEPSMKTDSEIIPDSFRESDVDSSKKTTRTPKTKTPLSGRIKRKLFRQNSGLLSLSPVDMEIVPPMLFVPKKKGRRQNVKSRQGLRDRSVVSRETTVNASINKGNINNDEFNEKVSDGSICRVKDKVDKKHTDNEDEKLLTSDEDENNTAKKSTKKAPKAVRKVVSKKIIIKKRAPEVEIMENLCQNVESSEDSLSENNSNEDFCMEKIIRRKITKKPRRRMIIVATGFSMEDKSLIKYVIKTLGSASLEEKVTKYTTHVVSTGIRTINLLRGIVRGCWLVGMDWILSSLENRRWMDPLDFEMAHYSKAVKENRRHRQSFGDCYVPDLFIASGPIYVENRTVPPTRIIKELIKTAGGVITEDIKRARIVVGTEGVKEAWVLDSITCGKVQPTREYKEKGKKRLAR